MFLFLDQALPMGAIYNIYFECETFLQEPSNCTKQQSIYPSLWQLSPRLQLVDSRRDPATGGCSSAHRETSCPGLDLRPWRLLGASSALRFGVHWLLLLPCTWACFRSLFHETLSQENLPILVWQAWIITISELEKNLERTLNSIPPCRNEDTEVQKQRDLATSTR